MKYLTCLMSTLLISMAVDAANPNTMTSESVSRGRTSSSDQTYQERKLERERERVRVNKTSEAAPIRERKMDMLEEEVRTRQSTTQRDTPPVSERGPMIRQRCVDRRGIIYNQNEPGYRNCVNQMRLRERVNERVR